ncbi:MAG: D-cysteine desulfhydrase family protein [Candidatus Bipolaricaulota bacterium]|nr:D-cysteine desulfhydrase family protein [Candidatus Bipolaricaulota bacterium]
MQIGAVERVRLGIFPTPLVELNALGDLLGGPSIFMKRDDLDGLGMGGNKLRKLEYAMADAVAQGVTTVITTGAVQSNHCRLTAAAANKLGMKCHLVLSGEEPQIATGNLLLDKILGVAGIHYVPRLSQEEKESTGHDPVEEKVTEIEKQLKRDGEVTYYIPNGCRSLHGALGYAGCVREVVEQMHSLKLAPDYFLSACGSVSTQTGLMLGSDLYCQAQARVIGISVSRDKDYITKKLTSSLAEAHAFLGLEDLPRAEIIAYDEYIGEGYGIPTKEMKEAISLVARKEGIFLDPVYTGKAMAGLIDLVKRGKLHKGENVIFIHTGGVPGMFAEAQVASLQL